MASFSSSDINIEEITKAVERDCTKACCAKQHSIIASCLAVIGFVWFISQDVANTTFLTIWIVFALSIILLRLLLTLKFSRLHIHESKPVHAQIFSLLLLVWGCTMAVGTLIIFPDLTVLEQATWFAMFIAMVASSSTSHSVFLPAYYCFSVPYFLAMGYVIVGEFPSAYNLNLVIYVFVMVSQASSTHKSNANIKESFKLVHINQSLVDSLKLKKEAAEQANLSKSKFLAAASHDLRQPMHALSLFAFALKSNTHDAKKIARLSEQVNEAVSALTELFDALLDISKLDASTFACDKKDFAVQTLLEKLKNDFAPIAREKNLTLVIPNKYDDVVYTDPTLLELILRNLISNAIRYTDKGRVELGLETSEQYVKFSVSDTGMGISEKHFTKLFDEFVQLHNPERDRKKGLGLGLSIVKRITNLLSTQINIESTEGLGSTFSFSIRLGDKQALSENKSDKPMHYTRGNDNIVVCIDDEPLILDAMKELLSNWGYLPIVSMSIENAIEQLETLNLNPKALIVDYRLPNHLTGIQVIKHFRGSYGKGLPAIIVTGDIGPEKLIEIKQSGFDLLHKPVQPAKLRSFLNQKV
jgi:signal transduction histidine kinase/CheY-like chemotaxis protein